VEDDAICFDGMRRNACSWRSELAKKAKSLLGDSWEYGTDIRGARWHRLLRAHGELPLADNRASEYRRLARECLRLAQTIATEEARLALVEMARVWTRLAEEQDVPWRPMPMPEGCQRAVQQQQQQILPKKGDPE
jgi:hypothetical protein